MNTNELASIIEEVLSTPDTEFKVMYDAMLDTIKSTIASNIDVIELANEYRSRGYSIAMVRNELEDYKTSINDLVDSLQDTATTHEKRDFLAALQEIMEQRADAIYEHFLQLTTIVQIQLIAPTAKMPTYAHHGDQGADIYSPVDAIIPPKTYGYLLPTGLAAIIPEGWAIAIRPRSGMSKKTTLRISNSVATIDSGYRGEIGILFDNIGDEPVEIHTGDRVAQFILERAYNAEFEQIDDVNIDQSDRGAGGFGSSGN